MDTGRADATMSSMNPAHDPVTASPSVAHSLVPLPFELQRFSDHEAMSQQAAELIAAEIRLRPDLLLGLATGSSPARTYELLAARRRSEPALFDRLRIFKLDEWGGLAMDDPASCELYLQTKLVLPLNVSPDRYFAWESQPKDPAAECQRVAGWLAEAGPIGLCVIGVGMNGHLALNEPAPTQQAGPHVAHLAEDSRQHPMLQEARSVARFGLTVGVADILHSRRILLLVSGPHKAEQLKRLLEPGISTEFPASLLWLHPAVTILCDEAAACLIPDYFQS